MSTLKVNTIEGLTSNVTITAQSVSESRNVANAAIAISVAFGA